MNNRKQKVKDLMENFQSLRRSMVFQTAGTENTPRITPSQWGALMAIEEEGKSTVKNVAKTLGISSSAATQLIDGLVESGYVIRETDTKDRRIMTLMLSQKTKKRVEKLKNQGIQRFLKLFDALNDKEFNQYILLNKKIIEPLLNK